MIRDLISSLLDRWANLHPFIRFLAVAVLASLVGLVTMKPSYRAFKQWPEVFNNDTTLTVAMLDRLLHHACVILIEGKSYRMKGQIDA